VFLLVPLVALPGGSIAGFLGFAFQNEGAAKPPFGARDFRLPYLGERYCLQGARGYWSHYRDKDGDEEGAYDFSMPYSTPILCAKEGHIIAFNDREPYPQPNINLGNGTYTPEFAEDLPAVNFMEVRHPDGSVARYQHFKTRDESKSESRRFDYLDLQKNPLHVRAGHELGLSGWPPAEAPELLPTGSGILWEGIYFALGLLAFATAFIVYYGVYHAPELVAFPLSLDVCPANGIKDGGSNYDYMREKYGDDDRAAGLDGILAANNGHKEHIDTCYCESFDRTYFQWSNTFSDLLFVILGILILWMHTQRRYGPGKPYANRITAINEYSRYYGLIIIFMGPGSMLFHGSMHAIGGFLDGTSMYGLAGFLVAYNWVRLWNLDDKAFHWIFWLSVGIFIVIAIVVYFVSPLDVTDVMYAFVGLAFVFQFFVLISRHIHSDGWGVAYFWIGAAFLIVAAVIREYSQTGKSLCRATNAFFNPDNHWLQGHAIWHVMSAFGLFLFYLYFARERSGTGFPHLHFAVREAPPPGPPIEAQPPAPRPGVTPPKLLWKPVKFSDMDVVRHLGRPFSMRKYRSDSLQSYGPPPIPAKVTEFAPQGGGEHPAESQPLRP
jgi:hypothetical protein